MRFPVRILCGTPCVNTHDSVFVLVGVRGFPLIVVPCLLIAFFNNGVVKMRTTDGHFPYEQLFGYTIEFVAQSFHSSVV